MFNFQYRQIFMKPLSIHRLKNVLWLRNIVTSSVPHASPKEHDITGTAHGNTCFSIRQPSCIILKTNGASMCHLCHLCLKICCFMSCSRDAHISPKQAWSKSMSTGRATCMLQVLGIQNFELFQMPWHFTFIFVKSCYTDTKNDIVLLTILSNLHRMLQSLFDLGFRCSWRPPSWMGQPWGPRQATSNHRCHRCSRGTSDPWFQLFSVVAVDTKDLFLPLNW